MNEETYIEKILGYTLAIVVMGFLGYKGVACVRDPEGEREKLINNISPGLFQDIRRSWTSVWWVRTWGIMVCSAIMFAIVMLAFTAISGLF